MADLTIPEKELRAEILAAAEAYAFACVDRAHAQNAMAVARDRLQRAVENAYPAGGGPR